VKFTSFILVHLKAHHYQFTKLIKLQGKRPDIYTESSKNYAKFTISKHRGLLSVICRCILSMGGHFVLDNDLPLVVYANTPCVSKGWSKIDKYLINMFALHFSIIFPKPCEIAQVPSKPKIILRCLRWSIYLLIHCTLIILRV